VFRLLAPAGADERCDGRLCHVLKRFIALY
jgi:hypothetical protein